MIWRLVYGLLTAGQTIISTTALILISLFVCSCVAVELIGKDRELLEDSVTGPIVHTCPGMIHHRRRIKQFMLIASHFPPVSRTESVHFSANGCSRQKAIAVELTVIILLLLFVLLLLLLLLTRALMTTGFWHVFCGFEVCLVWGVRWGGVGWGGYDVHFATITMNIINMQAIIIVIVLRHTKAPVRIVLSHHHHHHHHRTS